MEFNNNPEWEWTNLSTKDPVDYKDYEWSI